MDGLARDLVGTAFEEDRELLRNVARRIVGDGDADDVVQEALLRAMVRPPPDEEAPLRPWLVAVARHVAIDWWRSQRRTVLDELPEEAAPMEDPPRIELHELLAGLGALSAGEVVVLLLRDGLDLSVEDTAAAAETSAGTVRVLHHRARRKVAGAEVGPTDLTALERFLTWLLARATAGLPLRGRQTDTADPAFAAGVLEAHQRLLDAMVTTTERAGRTDLTAMALLSRATARATHDPRGVLPDLERALALGAPPGPTRMRMIGPLVSAGRRDEAEAVARAGLLDGDQRRLPWFHQFLAWLASMRGDRAAAAFHVEQARATATTPGTVAPGHSAAAYVALAEERYDEARHQFLAALPIIRAHGNAHDEPALLNNIAVACTELGRLDEAEEAATAALAQARARGDLRRLAAVHGTLGTLALRRGRWGDAVTHYERSRQAAERAGARPHVRDSVVLLAVVELLRGRAAAAAGRLHALGEPRSAAEGRIERTYTLAADLACGRAVQPELAALREEAAAAGHRSVAAGASVLLGDDAPIDPAVAATTTVAVARAARDAGVPDPRRAR